MLLSSTVPGSQALVLCGYRIAWGTTVGLWWSWVPFTEYIASWALPVVGLYFLLCGEEHWLVLANERQLQMTCVGGWAKLFTSSARPSWALSFLYHDNQWLSRLWLPHRGSLSEWMKKAPPCHTCDRCLLWMRIHFCCFKSLRLSCCWLFQHNLLILTVTESNPNVKPSQELKAFIQWPFIFEGEHSTG